MAEEKRAEGLERAGDLQIVTFFLSNEEFGVDILLVQEIIRPTTITEVPNTPTFLEGVINLRGKVVPVVDLRRRLDLEVAPMDKSSRIMIIELEDKVTGFIVDSVSKVMSVHSESIQSAPEIGNRRGGERIHIRREPLGGSTDHSPGFLQDPHRS